MCNGILMWQNRVSVCVRVQCNLHSHHHLAGNNIRTLNFDVNAFRSLCPLSAISSACTRTLRSYCPVISHPQRKLLRFYYEKLLTTVFSPSVIAISELQPIACTESGSMPGKKKLYVQRQCRIVIKTIQTYSTYCIIFYKHFHWYIVRNFRYLYLASY